VPTVVGSGQDQPPLGLKWPPLLVTNQYKITSKMCIHKFIQHLLSVVATTVLNLSTPLTG